MSKKNWINLKRGLSEDPKHRARMGECIWLFLHIIDLADWETGIVYDWKDEAVAADMTMPITTLRHQRRKLEELDYIRCKQGQRSQDIYILQWINPRNYSGAIINPRNQSDNVLSPSEIQGYNHGDNASDNHPSSGINTPSSSSESKSRSVPAPAFDFSNMTVPQAYKVPTLKMFNKATGWLPADILWEQVHNFITENNLTEEQIKAAAIAWIGKGYNRRNVMGILEWAKNGTTGEYQQKQQPETKPAIDETRVQETQKMLAEKMGGSFVPRPANLERPRIGRQS